MTHLGYEEAVRTLENDQYAQFDKVSTTKHIILSPKYLGRVKNGIVEQLNSELNFTSKSLGGILIAYSNIHLLNRVGDILAEQPYIHFDVQADFIVFKPVVGCLLRGVVNKVGKNHVGCLVHNFFNASIRRPSELLNDWHGKNMDVGDEFIFKVTRVSTYTKLMCIEGILTEDGNYGRPNRKRTFEDVDMDILHGNTDEDITDISMATPVSKKRKKDKRKENGQDSVSESLMDASLTGNYDNTEDIANVSIATPLSKKKKKSKKKNKGQDSVDEDVMDTSLTVYSELNMSEIPADGKHRNHGITEDDITNIAMATPGSKKKKKKKDKKKENGTESADEILSESTVDSSMTADSQQNISELSSKGSKSKKKKTKKKHESDDTARKDSGEIVMNTSCDFSDEVMASQKQNDTFNISGVYLLEQSPVGSSTCKKKSKKFRKSEQDSANHARSSGGDVSGLADISMPSSPLLFSSQEEAFTYNKKRKKSKKPKKEYE